MREVFVKKILGTGPAVQKNVLLGDVVSKAWEPLDGSTALFDPEAFKVNKQKMDWRTELTEDDYEHIEHLAWYQTDEHRKLLIRSLVRSELRRSLLGP